MYQRFIDDLNLVPEVVEAGWKFCNETRRMIFQEDLVQNDSTVEDDRRTALVIKDIANSVHPMIQMEEDCPSNHNDGKMPILDLECWMDDEGIVRFQHYEKPMANKQVLSAKSALPIKQKRNIHINEYVNRLRNCDLDMKWDNRNCSCKTIF